MGTSAVVGMSGFGEDEAGGGGLAALGAGGLGLFMIAPHVVSTLLVRAIMASHVTSGSYKSDWGLLTSYIETEALSASSISKTENKTV